MSFADVLRDAADAVDWGLVRTVAPPLLGALVGGLLSARIADRTLRATQAQARQAAAADRRRDAAIELVGILLDAREDLMGEDGHLLPSDQVKRPLRRLRRDVAVRLPHLAGTGVESRVENLLTLLPVERASVELAAPDDPAALARVAQRLVHDRNAYLEWVVASLQDLSAGRPLPPGTDPPAPITDGEALPWSAPAVPTLPSLPSSRRRRLLRRGAEPGATA